MKLVFTCISFLLLLFNINCGYSLESHPRGGLSEVYPQNRVLTTSGYSNFAYFGLTGYMPRDSVGNKNGDNCGYNQGGNDCYMHRDSVGAEDGDSYGYNQGGKDCYMHWDSVGAEDSDSYNQGGKDCYMPRDSVGAEDSDSYGYN